MNKYLLVKPSEFWRYDSVDLEGYYPHVDVQDFDLDPRFNYLMFEVPFKKGSKGQIILDNKAKELFTGQEFDIVSCKNEETDAEEIRLSSSYLGLYTKNMELNKIMCKPSKMAGMVNFLKEDTDLLSVYKSELEALTDASRFYKSCFEETINGPSKSSKRELRRLYKRG